MSSLPPFMIHKSLERPLKSKRLYPKYSPEIRDKENPRPDKIVLHMNKSIHLTTSSINQLMTMCTYH